MRTFSKRGLFATVFSVLILSALMEKSVSAAPVPLGNTLFDSKETYPFRDAYSLVTYGSLTAHAVLSVTPTALHQPSAGANSSAEQFSVDLRFYNDGSDEREFYNSTWSRLIPEPGRLALYSADKHYICDLFSSMGGSRTTVSAYDWRRIPAFGYMGVTLRASLPYQSLVVLPPGKYFLQVIYLARVMQPMSESGTKLFDDDDNTELFRSNAVPITIISSPPAHAAKPGLSH